MTLSDFSANRLDGTWQNLADYSGKVALIVNVASQCGFTPQYKDLQELRERH
ncbi:MAG: glutathione peroxidase, partial [Cucumibacter sp.]